LQVPAQESPEFLTEIPGLTARGKDSFTPVPDLTKGGKPDDKHDWTLGPTGLRGWMWAMRLQTTLARQILVTKVDPGSPADGRIKVGDVILGAGGGYFRDDARKAFGRAITEAEKEENRGILKLKRWRAGEVEDAELKIGVMGSYSALSPFDCPKSARILDDACQAIARRGLKDNIPGYVNALGLLSTGDPKYLPMVRDFCRSLDPLKETGMSSWTVGYMNILLSEYYLLTKDEEVLPEIRAMALYFAKGQDLAGTWGHTNAGANGICFGYGAMSQPSLSVGVSLQLNQKCGVDDPVVAKAIGKTDVFFSTHVDKGSISLWRWHTGRGARQQRPLVAGGHLLRSSRPAQVLRLLGANDHRLLPPARGRPYRQLLGHAVGAAGSHASRAGSHRRIPPRDALVL
jgi:hypothetical protein